MARARSPNRERAFEMWKESKGKLLLKEIATKLGVKDTQVRKWKNQDKWDEVLKGNVTITKRNVTKQKIAEPVIESDDLSDKQKMFCLHYIKYFNATKAYQKVYGCSYDSARTEGPKTLAKPCIKKEIERLKAEQQQELFLGARDVLQKYIDIAFADITDFVDFGQREMPELDSIGEPRIDENGDEITYSISFVNLKNHEEVDGTLITEVKKGKDGVSVKLADKMKALEFLSKYTDLLSENDRKKLQNEKLKADIEKSKAELEKIANDKPDKVLVTIVDDIEDDVV